MAALAELLRCDLFAQSAAPNAAGASRLPHFAPKAKRVILFQSGAPSQLDLFDYKPQLAKTHTAPICPIRSATASD